MRVGGGGRGDGEAIFVENVGTCVGKLLIEDGVWDDEYVMREELGS